MILISHRGNLNGPSIDTENKIETIDKAISLGYDVEIDLWYVGDFFYLGHDEPVSQISYEFLNERKSNLWIHCKNIDCLDKLYGTDFNYFWHDKDLTTITSKGYFWSLNGHYLKNGITVELELVDNLPKNILGVCTDYVDDYKKIYE